MIRILSDAKFATRSHADECFLAGPCTFHVYTIVTSPRGKVSRSYNPSDAATPELAVDFILASFRETDPKSTVQIYGVAPIAR